MTAVDAHAEIERKYAVPQDAVVPDLAVDGDAVPLPMAHLEAVYYDTDDDALLRARIALRRRSGGTDAGWHLKLPARLGRLEVQEPPRPDDPDAVPEGIATLVQSRVRGRSLSPIARIRTNRTAVVVQDRAGIGRIEFVDDHVTATDLATGRVREWREWEAEQIGDDSDASARMLERVELRLLAAGATHSESPAKLAAALGGPAAIATRLGTTPPDTTTAGGVLAAAAAALADELHAGELAVLHGTDDAVHQLRRTIRRIRALLLLEPVVGPQARLNERLRTFGRALGASRDREVAAAGIESLFAGLDHEPGAAAARARLVTALGNEADAKRLAVVADFGSPGHFAMLDAVEALPRTIHGPRAAEPADVVLPPLIAELAASALQKPHAAFTPRHRDRKTARAARDAAGVIRDGGPDVLPPGFRRLERRTRALQDSIGRCRDAEALVALLRTESATATAAGENAFVYGLLASRADRLRLAGFRDAERDARALRAEVVHLR